MGIEGIGARVARKEDKRFIMGAGRYVDDMVVPGMKHAAFVRSPHAHAQIKKIDVKAAQAMLLRLVDHGRGHWATLLRDALVHLESRTPDLTVARKREAM